MRHTLKIVFPVYKLASGGAERTVSYLASYLAEKGYEVYVVSLLNGNFYGLSHDVHHISMRIVGFPDHDFNKWAPTYFIRRCRNYVIRKIKIPIVNRLISPDLVFSMLSDMSDFYLKGHRKGNYKLISSERANPLLESPEDYARRKQIFEECDGIVFQTARASECYSEEIRDKSVIIPNAVGNPDVQNIIPPEARKHYICAIGRLASQKNYKLMLEAFYRFHVDHEDYRLVIYGVGPEEQVIRGIIDSMNLGSFVDLMGSDPHAVAKCADAACYVMTSHYEGMPNALMEAMAAGIPSVSVDCPFGPAELITSGENGILVPIDDVEALSEAMAQITDNRELADRCSRNGRKLLETNSVERQCALFEDFILRVAGEDTDGKHI